MPKAPAHLDKLMPLLITRRQTAQLLGCSVSKVITMEKLGLLTPRKLIPSDMGVVHHSYAEVEALARGEGGE
jgi:hypothetical protein